MHDACVDLVRQLVLWTLVPFALSAAALSKQTPVLLGTPIVLALALVGAPSVARAVKGLAAGSAASLAILAAAGFAGDVDWELVRVYLVQLPLETGGARGGRADSTAMSLFLLSGLFLVVVIGPSLLVNHARGRARRLARRGPASALGGSDADVRSVREPDAERAHRGDPAVLRQPRAVPPRSSERFLLAARRPRVAAVRRRRDRRDRSLAAGWSYN